MKTKILAGILSLALGFAAVGCDDDDDYSIATGQKVQSVMTGSSDVTATTATLNGTVSGLDGASSASYSVGFNYGTAEGQLTKQVDASLDGTTMTATITGLANGSTIFYQAYVTLQGKVTYKGEVKSLVTTNAKVATGDASAVNAFGATLAGSATDAPADAVLGFCISASSDVEAVRAGLKVAAEGSASFSLAQSGLVPETEYFYAAYCDLGAGVIYGDVKSFTTNEMAIDADADFVDLGLSTKWAKCNFGATKPSEMGGYYSFGDMTGVCNATKVSELEALGCNVTDDTYRNAATDVVFKTTKVATMPTADEFEELFTLCQVEWTTEDGVEGCKFTGPNGNSIFMPAAGSRTGNALSGVGEAGEYMTGSVNTANSDFNVCYTFGKGYDTKSTAARFKALAVRPVTVAKNIPFDKALLNKVWVIDLNADGESFRFDGPLSYYGTDDSWETVTNNKAGYFDNIDSWNWSPKYSENTWLGAAANYGTMEFKEDGTVVISRRVVTKDESDKDVESYVEETGTYKVDEVNKTISLSIDVLGFGNFNNLTLDAKTTLKIFSLTEETLQIAILRDPDLSGEGACSLAYNYTTKAIQDKFTGMKVSLMTVGADWGGNWGTNVGAIPPAELIEKGSVDFTVEFNGQMNGGANVFLLDVNGLAAKFPTAFVAIKSIKIDGKDVAYNSAKFRYGDIEDKGNYRVEFFNTWGATAKPGQSPFSNREEDGGDEMAISMTEKVEIEITVFADVNVARKYDVNLITINPSWGGTWGYNAGQQIEVKYDAESHLYSLDETTLSFSYESTEHAAGSIMTFLEVADIYGYFPQMHATLDALALDGTDVTFDASKVLDANESHKYRLELWNMYGATSKAGCAFGTAGDDGIIHELAFSSKMELTATFHSLSGVSFE